MTLTGQNILGFDLSEKGTNSFFGINPRINKGLSTKYYQATKDEIDEAVNLKNKDRKKYSDEKIIFSYTDLSAICSINFLQAQKQTNYRVPTPPMGSNSINSFGGAVNEEDVKANQFFEGRTSEF